MPSEPGWNVNSRLALTYSLLDNQSFTIDDYHASREVYTEDVAFHAGHYYTDKIIGTSILGLPGYALAKIIDTASGGALSWDAKRYLTTLFCSPFYSAFASAIFFETALLIGLGFFWAIAATLFFALGTLLLPYSFLFMPYAPATFFVILSLYLIRKEEKNQSLELIPLFRIGLLLGIAVLCEYTYVIVAVGMLIYLIIKIPNKKDIKVALWGFIIPLIFFAVYLLICFQKILLPYHLEENPLFREGMSKGIAGISFPRLSVLYFITFHSYRGLFFYSPILFLGVIGIATGLFQYGRRLKALLSLFVVAGFLTINSGYYMWWGGWTNGARLLIPAIPFLALEAVEIAKRSIIFKALLILTGIASIILTFIPAAVDPQTPQGYNKFATELLQPSLSTPPVSPILKMQFPAFMEGNLGRNFGNHILGLKGINSLTPLFIWMILCLSAIAVMRHIEMSEIKRKRQIDL